MRYLVLNFEITDEEILARKKYIEKIFKVYFLIKKHDKFIEYVSFPNNFLDIIMIIGHNYIIYDYLKTHMPNENKVILVTCPCEILSKVDYGDRTVYIAKSNDNNQTELYDGMEWNINFKITDSELTFYNINNSDIDERINSAFERMK